MYIYLPLHPLHKQNQALIQMAPTLSSHPMYIYNNNNNNNNNNNYIDDINSFNNLPRNV